MYLTMQLFLLPLLLLLLLLLCHAPVPAHCQLQCNGTNRQKRLVIRNPETRQLANLDSCQYNVASWSTQVCQVRIDFERFELPQPQLLGNGEQLLECVDYLQVQRFKLCGRNTGQHIYVPLKHGELLELHFSLSSRSSQSTWQLRLTQLECPQESKALDGSAATNKIPLFPTVRPMLPFLGGRLPRTFFGFNGSPGPAEQLLQSLTASPDEDYDLLAPLGCDQFYRSTNGGIVSFNYAGGIYMPNMNYAICVQSKGQSEISYTIDHFALSTNRDDTGPGYDTDCHSTVRTTGRASDYLLIPNSYMANNVALQPTYYCGSGLVGTKLRARAPFIIYFSSDAQTNMSETGFQLTYNVEQQSRAQAQAEL
ncbi:uncharacterized protein LOC115630726 [Scaptodrosophila lebanonensis]|uniref:Uncharacterized protein LOC115630726 n=1 Tax=Drosophila lebanonensis TaxID=7225 RepID=A0A6J2U3N2_DROLE|nr:uncharacterized protein LOC115630726 [Scaptodrosophila lebanonensis]